MPASCQPFLCHDDLRRSLNEGRYAAKLTFPAIADSIDSLNGMR